MKNQLKFTILERFDFLIMIYENDDSNDNDDDDCDDNDITMTSIIWSYYPTQWTHNALLHLSTMKIVSLSQGSLVVRK